MEFHNIPFSKCLERKQNSAALPLEWPFKKRVEITKYWQGCSVAIRKSLTCCDHFGKDTRQLRAEHTHAPRQLGLGVHTALLGDIQRRGRILSTRSGHQKKCSQQHREPLPCAGNSPGVCMAWRTRWQTLHTAE